jgi:hypothetical protein
MRHLLPQRDGKRWRAMYTKERFVRYIADLRTIFNPDIETGDGRDAQ